MANTDIISRLENIVNTSQDQKQREAAQKELDRLASIGSAQVQVAASAGGSDDAQIKALLDALTIAVQTSGASVNKSDLQKLVVDELKKIKIDYDDLSPSLQAFLASNQKVQVTIKQLSGITTSAQIQADFLNRKIVQLILSDMLAKNNVYLYGGAGTGKTYVAEKIAKILGWSKITLNCNQYTSPLDILGGQTIEGYQEGKISQAWSNKIILSDGTVNNVDGVVLILDELPKIDPNTAGILNEALAKVKQYDIDDATGQIIPPTIENGRGQKMSLGNLLVIATGNVPLNTIDPDYEANFKQDLSLQDRFVGSTYKVLYDYEYEFNNTMKGFAFIWIFCTKLREAIVKNRATNQAFVSMRLMENLRETYKVYREAKANPSSTSAIKNPKTIIDSMETFFSLFKETPKAAILNEVDFRQFKKIVEQKDKMPFDASNINFDTAAELAEGKAMVDAYKAATVNTL